MPFISNVSDDQEISKYFIGFKKGLNTVQNESLVDDQNLIAAQNCILEVDGVGPRPGATSVFDEASASYVYGSTAFYKKTTGVRQQVRIANSKLQYRASAATAWTQVDTHTFADAMTTFVQARDKLFIYNGEDNLRYWDGTAINEYTAILTPTNLTVTPTGTTGSTAYSYEITAFNAYGETVATAATNTSTGNATLSTTNYNKLDWTASTNALGYNIYGRKATGWGRVYLATVYTNTYNDTGAAEEVTAKIAPDANNTGGIIGKYGIFSALGRQFVAGVYEGSTYYPTRLYYSGTVQYVDSFVGAEFGGGWVEVASNDGGEIVDIKPYQSSVLIFKTNGIFRFYFTSAGLPAIVEITRDHGGVSFYGSQEIDNDYVFVAQIENRLAVMSVGEREGYVAGSLRTNEISIYIRDELKGANRSKLHNTASFKFDSKFAFTFTTGSNTENDRGYVIDSRFGGWVYWTGLPMTCSHYSIYDDGTNVKLYGGSNHSGYMIRLFESNKNDDNAAFTTIVGTKSFNLDMFDVEKIFRNPVLWFKYLRGGTIDLEIWADGTRKSGTAMLSATSDAGGAGVFLMGQQLAGETYGGADVQEGSDKPQEIQMMEMCRSLKFYLIDNTVNTNWLFMGLRLLASPLQGKPMKDTNRVQLHS
jgi:hypothetical protein